MVVDGPESRQRGLINFRRNVKKNSRKSRLIAMIATKTVNFNSGQLSETEYAGYVQSLFISS